MSPTRVLVADDVDDVRLLIRLTLDRQVDVQVIGEAITGAEAVERTCADTPDVVVLDIDMPVMDGMAALEAIRRLAPATRVVMYSAFDERRDEALALGATAWFTKTQPLSDLAAAVLGTGPERSVLA